MFSNKRKPPKGGFLLLVAGTGIEPMSGGYEPPEVPLLHPAILFYFLTLSLHLQRL